MKRISMRLFCALAVIALVAGGARGWCAALSLPAPQDKSSPGKSAEPRMIQVEEDVWLEKNREIRELRDELLRVSAALKLTEAEKKRAEQELITVKKGIAGKDVKVHRVEEGENLWKIAQKYYKDPHKWLWLFKANAEQIEDPDNLYPEQVIDIPRY